MRLLVTGGAGFIGSHIVDAALDKGWQVCVLDSLDPAIHLEPPVLEPRVELMTGDATDPATVQRALDGITTVCHQSAKVGLGVSFADAPEFIRNNDFATAVLLASMERQGIRQLVLASSMVVYGEGAYTDPATGHLVRPGPRAETDLRAGIYDPRSPQTGEILVPGLLTEDARLDPRNVYAASKLSQEHLAASWARAGAGTAIALEYHNVYGPRMPRDTPYAGVASLFRSALARGEAPKGCLKTAHSGAASSTSATSPPQTLPPWSPLASLRIRAPESGFRAYNVGADEVRTIGDVAAPLSTLSGGPEPVVSGGFRLGDVRHITASSQRDELGWCPAVGFEQGIREFSTAPLRGA